MSYLLSLDEYSDEQISNEYIRRVSLLRNDCCTYCEKRTVECKCRMKNQQGKAKGASGTQTVMGMRF